jgi:hypothetical protein
VENYAAYTTQLPTADVEHYVMWTTQVPTVHV